MFQFILFVFVSMITSFSYAAQNCESSYIMTAGEFIKKPPLNLELDNVEEMQPRIDGIEIPEKVLKEKQNLVAEKIANQERKWRLVKEVRVGGTTSCAYKTNVQGLMLILEETRKYYTIELRKKYSKTTNDRKLDIDLNALSIKYKTRKRNLPAAYAGLYIASVDVVSEFDYYYSCGFRDCTFEDEERLVLGELKSLRLSK